MRALPFYLLYRITTLHMPTSLPSLLHCNITFTLFAYLAAYDTSFICLSSSYAFHYFIERRGCTLHSISPLALLVDGRIRATATLATAPRAILYLQCRWANDALLNIRCASWRRSACRPYFFSLFYAPP